jgi:hypothetical protein
VGWVISLLVVSVALLVGILASGVHTPSARKNVWSDPRGQRLPETTVLYSCSGPEHCGWQDIVFMSIGYRSGLTQPGLTGRASLLS